MRISDWSSDVCSSDLDRYRRLSRPGTRLARPPRGPSRPRRPPHDRRDEGLFPAGRKGRPHGKRPFRREQQPVHRGREGPIDRKSTRLTPVTNAHLVCRLLLEKKKAKVDQRPRTRAITTRLHTVNSINLVSVMPTSSK